MRVKQVSLVLPLVITLCLSAIVSAQSAGRIESMKLLTPNVGWAATNQKLFWTTDGGAEWKDITPKAKAQRTIASVFFLDAANGWALLSYSGKEDPTTSISEALFDLATTGDSGASWSVQHLDVPDPDLSRGLSGEAWLDFVDSQHGWLMVRMNGSTAVSIGVLRATDDGGKTWKSLGVPAAGPIRFVTPTDGWLEGGPTEDVTQGVYVTRDGGRNWTLITLKAPAEVLPKAYPTYQLPQFVDKDSGFLLVTFSEPNDESPKLALFTTKDGGRTWTFGSALAEGGSSWHTAIVGSDWIAAGCPGGKLALVHGAGGRMSASPPWADKTDDVCSVSGGAVFGVTFGNSNRGWLLFFGGKLLSTPDGGSTWKDITPNDAAKVPVRRESITVPVSSERTHGVSVESLSQPPSSNVSTHLGFDKFPVIPRISDMQNWMNSSPYYDVGIYLPGSKNKRNDPNLTPAWVSAAQGQGWGIMPIWFGLQSACSCYVNSTGQCVPFTYQISTNTTQAKTDGINEAKAAISAAQNLGLNPTIIFHDIENYTPDGSTCSLPVQAFLGGWDQQMHTVGLAGVYGNPAPAAKDFSKASPIPDDVWIAKYTAPGQAPLLTIWALGTLGDSPYWTSSQRIHQGQQNLVQTWGSANSYQIDPDIENATIIAGNGSKNFSTYSPSSFDYPGSCGTWAYGINDLWGGAFINGAGLTGEIVGQYDDCSGYAHAFLLDIQYSNVDYPGAVWSIAYGINDLGQIVGAWQDASYCVHGYLLSPGKTPVSIDNPSAVCPGGGTWTTGINDASQIAGWYTGATGTEGFLYYSGKFDPVSLPGSCCYNASGVGINGDAAVAGSYIGSGIWNGFVESLAPPSWTGTPSSFFDAAGLVTVGQGIDNNGDVAGYYEIQYLAACGKTRFRQSYKRACLPALISSRQQL
jgi:photosystem II stability/assembly factor-like uncharacterized protein